MSFIFLRYRTESQQPKTDSFVLLRAARNCVLLGLDRSAAESSAEILAVSPHAKHATISIPNDCDGPTFLRRAPF